MIAIASKFLRATLALSAAAALLSTGCRRDESALGQESEPLAGDNAGRLGCAEPAVKPDEACYYAKPCYEGLIRCVGPGESYQTGVVVVNSVVLGAHVTQANTATCQFYGPDVSYAQALEGCSTDRLWTNTETITPPS